VLRPTHRPRAGLLPLVLAVAVVGVVQSPPAVAPAAAEVAGAVAGAVTGGRTVPAAPSAGALPPGWSVHPGPEGRVLVWAPGRQLPFGGARIEVVAGDRHLGPARVAADLRSLEVPLPADLGGTDLAGLQVVAAGRRLDAGPTALPGPVGDPSGEPGPGGPARVAQPSAAVAAAVPLNPVDPGRAGPYRTVERSYTQAAVRFPGFRSPLEVEGVVVAPVGARGARPMVLMLHGRHATCFRGGPKGQASNSWPCRAGERPIPSHRGYLGMQRLLASQGYLTVSVAANGVGGQDWDLLDGGAAARAAVLRQHLDLWARWSTRAGRRTAPAALQALPAADLRSVVLVGHSRGGEGANRVALDSTVPVGSPTAKRPPWRVAGVVHLAPLAAGMNPAPGVPSVVLLPSCDGDIVDQQGQLYTDGVRDLVADPVLRSSVFVIGANHNYFNSEWTPGTAAAPATDDWFDRRDAACGTGRGSTRLTAAHQRTVAATYTAAAVRAFVLRDAKVVPLLDGSRVRAASAGSARVLTHALGGNRVRFVVPGRSGPGQTPPRVTATGGPTARICAAIDPAGYRVTCRGAMPADGVHPHFGYRMTFLDDEPSMRAVSTSWSRAAGSIRILPRTTTSLAASTSLTMRAAVPPGSRDTRAQVRITDARGRTATLGDLVLQGTPRNTLGGSYWAQEVRLPLAAARGLDLRRVASLTLVPRSTRGQLLLLDAWGHRPGLSAAPPASVPRLDVPTVNVTEGDSGTRTIMVRVALSGTRRPGPASVHVALADSRNPTIPPGDSGYVATIGARQRWVDVPVPVQGNTIDDGDGHTVRILVRGLTAVTAGEWNGAAVVVDDEPTPRATITPTATAVTEGQTVTWTVTLDAPSTVQVVGLLAPVAPPDGSPELSTDDVPPGFLADLGVQPPARPVALSGIDRSLLWSVPAGQTSAPVSVPTVRDDRAEGVEHLVLRVEPSEGTPQPPGLPVGQTFAATVTD